MDNNFRIELERQIMKVDSNIYKQAYPLKPLSVAKLLNKTMKT